MSWAASTRLRFEKACSARHSCPRFGIEVERDRAVVQQLPLEGDSRCPAKWQKPNKHSSE